MADFSYEDLILRYREIRDQKAAFKAEYEAKIEAIEQEMEIIENWFLEESNRLGLNTFSTPSGIAYKNTQTRVNVTDRLAFESYVIENRAWTVARFEPIKEEAVHFLETHDTPPPGVRIDRLSKFNIRKS